MSYISEQVGKEEPSEDIGRQHRIVEKIEQLQARETEIKQLVAELRLEWISQHKNVNELDAQIAKCE